MPDLTINTPPEKPHEPPSLEDQVAVGLNEKTVETLGDLLPSMIDESLRRLFGAELGQKIEKARAQVDRSKVLTPVVAVGPREPFTREQTAIVVCARIARQLNRPFQISPEMDDGGRLTEWLDRPPIRMFPDSGDLQTQAVMTPISGSGAYTLPEEFVSELEKRPGQPPIIWPILTKDAVKQRTVKKPTVTTYITSNTGSSANVNSATTATEITETQPVFNEIQWDLEDFDTRIPIKLDLLEESPLSLYNEILALVGDAFARNHEQMPIAGRGHASLQPIGLQMGAAGITAVAITAAPTVANILDFVAQIPQRYRGNAKLVMDAQTRFAVASTFAQNIRAAEYLAGLMPAMLENEFVAEGKIIGGDFSRYVVKYIRLMQLITSIAAERKTQEIVVTETWTGEPTQTDAFRIGTGVTY